MSFSESLTVRILGDSSALRQELESASGEIQKLQQNISGSASSTDKLKESFTKLSAGLKPLQQINAQLLQIQQKVRAISQQSVTLNVQPAIQALQQLMRYAMLAAQQIHTIMGTTGGGRTSPIAPTAGPAGGTPTGNSPRNFAGGGLVAGPSGIDRVPTRLSAGEYVLSQSAVKTLGVSFLEQLNRQPQQTLTQQSAISSPTPLIALPTQLVSKRLNDQQPQVHAFAATANRSHSPSLAQTVSHNTDNHFGGITINVQETTDIDSLFRDMRSQGIGQRHRRG